MKSPIRNLRFCVGLLVYSTVIASAAWWLGRSSLPDSSAPSGDATAREAGIHSRKLSADAGARAISPGARLTDSEADEIMRGAKPDVPNAVLRKKLWLVLFEGDEFTRMGRFQSLLTLMRPEDAPLIEQLFYDADKDGRSYWKEWSAFFWMLGKDRRTSRDESAPDGRKSAPVFSSLPGSSTRLGADFT